MADRTSGDYRETSWAPALRPSGGSVIERPAVERKPDVLTQPDLPTLLERAAARDLKARVRDRAAFIRDREARERDLATALGDVTAARRDRVHVLGGSTTATYPAGQRERAARQRQEAAEHRVAAAAERQAAAHDRELAARERLMSLADREALGAEIQHQHDLRDEARRHQARAERLARTLQRSLSPPRLPQIAGIEVAAHYEPAAPEDVGGDFYDLFPLSPSRSGFFLGDVCGKGPDAAVVTSLARYTMRTAAMLHERPDEVLMNLNAALLMDGDGAMQTCTAVYGEIDVDGDLTLAVAGHPPPLVVREHGAVEIMPAHGTLLGVFADPVFHVCRVSLGPGDAIIIYSDGMLDTEIDGARLDEPRVAELLVGTAAASAADLVARLMRATRGNARPLRDDVAILALCRTPATV